MKQFTLLQRLRNKIRVARETTLHIASNAKIVGCKIIIRGDNNTLIIEEKARLRHATIEIMGERCTIHIGRASMIGDGCYLQVKERGISLRIGDDCGLSRNVKVMASDGHPIYREHERINPAADITIGNHVWIADNATILKGVQIGHGSVVGINATLTRSIGENSIAAGNPARVIKEHIHWEDRFSS